MTAKDLHFSLDAGLTPPESQSARQATAARGQTRPRLAPVPGARPEGRPKRRQPAAVKTNRQWLAVAAIALLNMAFLALAALWLTGNAYQFDGAGSRTANSADAVSASTLAAMQAGLTERTEQLGQQLGEQLGQQLDPQLQSLQSTLQEQGRLLAALQSEVAQLRGRLAATAVTTPAQASAKGWHINLGSFPTTRGALELQQQMKAWGHAALVRPETADGETSYRVLIDGFRDRETADNAARKIMEQTNLNGLWVWNEE